MLRNLSFTPPYMHDGRFKTLEEVLEHYATGVTNEGRSANNSVDRRMDEIWLSEIHFADLLAFLKTLDDPSLNIEEKYSDPFIR